MSFVLQSKGYWILFLLVIIVFVFIFVSKFNRSEDLSSLVLESTPAYTVFYIGWGGGAIARSCPKFDCGISHSFQEAEALELPYSSIEDMPEWVDVSRFCKKDCFVRRNVFSLSSDTALITPSWENRIARIVCESNSGSGLLVWSGGKEAIITAKHVVEAAEFCRVYLPKQGYKELNKKSFLLHEEHDLAIMLLGYFNENVKAFAKELVPVCQSGTRREAVVVFGYPNAAHSNDVTVAEGIISNIKENSYLTDANVGPGNSGGVVIKKEENCYLGIPVLISRGAKANSEGKVEYIENWGEILKATILDYDEIKGFSF